MVPTADRYATDSFNATLNETSATIGTADWDTMQGLLSPCIGEGTPVGLILAILITPLILKLATCLSPRQ
jgi:ascorbate-specific PTS system EIIC-type component UlaA